MIGRKPGGDPLTAESLARRYAILRRIHDHLDLRQCRLPRTDFESQALCAMMDDLDTQCEDLLSQILATQPRSLADALAHAVAGFDIAADVFNNEHPPERRELLGGQLMRIFAGLALVLSDTTGIDSAKLGWASDRSHFLRQWAAEPARPAVPE
ncbi:MAG: hypothetical protein NT133_01115 [Alphaproteobacteria bacterium]|nr:hypothetical protein [Alphaproteobacteria bacterium]